MPLYLNYLNQISLRVYSGKRQPFPLQFISERIIKFIAVAVPF